MLHLKKTPAVFCIALLFFLSDVSRAQIIPAVGEASLTIEMGGAERKFTFPNAMPSNISAQKINSALGISFNKEFEKESESVWVSISLEPAGKGNFIMTQPNKEPPNTFSIDIRYTKTNSRYEIKELNLNSNWHKGANDEWLQDASSGTAEITQYGAVGSYIIGNFQATLMETKDNGSNGAQYKVSGNLKIKLTRQ